MENLTLENLSLMQPVTDVPQTDAKLNTNTTQEPTNNAQPTRRTFTAHIVTIENNVEVKTPLGKFIGKVPKQAASKACSVAMRNREATGVNTIVKICIQETTKGSRHKIYYYDCSREKLACPQVIQLSNGKTINYQYNNTVKLCQCI